jgi:hypothetical protein
MVPVFTGHGCRQTGYEPCLRVARNLFETVGGKVMAFVDNQVPIIPNDFVHYSFVDKALDGGNVKDSGRHSASTSNPADSIWRQPQKHRQSLNPLFLQLPPMH